MRPSIRWPHNKYHISHLRENIEQEVVGENDEELVLDYVRRKTATGLNTDRLG